MRAEIISRVTEALDREPFVHALWLEGADGTGTVDAFSDIDLVADVDDGYEDAVLTKVEAVLQRLGALDLCYEGPRYHGQLRTKFYHVAGTPESLMIDFTVQSHSRDYQFVIEDETTVPVVLFDKSQVIQWRHQDVAELRREMAEALPHLESMVRQKARATKYTQRGQFLEAMIYYHRYVMGPLVQVLRMKHTPLLHEHFLVHASRQLPGPVVARLEELYKVTCTAEMAAKIEAAAAWFWETVDDLGLPRRT
ncbi:MAG TPA: hypothetical protein VNT75_24000 [Symbiobacteriaceae bacterium]|nr:hypothetical protein [Symbiobacteriaceae bacterium]